MSLISQLWKRLGPNTTPITQVSTNIIQKMTARTWTHIRVFLCLLRTSISRCSTLGGFTISVPSPICSTLRLTVGRIMNRVSLSPRESTKRWVTVASRADTDAGRRKVTGGNWARIRELQGREYASPPCSGVEWRHRGQEIEGALLGSGGCIGVSWILRRHSVQKTWRHSSMRGSLESWSYSW